MAKKSYQIVRVVPEEGDPKAPSYSYTVRKPTRGEKASVKLRLRKYNPVTRKHEWFVEGKLPNPKAK